MYSAVGTKWPCLLRTVASCCGRRGQGVGAALHQSATDSSQPTTEALRASLMTYFRTSEQDARRHDKSHVGRIFTIPETSVISPSEDVHRLLPLLPPKYERLCKIVDEYALLIRKPAVEIIDCVLRQRARSSQVVRDNADPSVEKQLKKQVQPQQREGSESVPSKETFGVHKFVLYGREGSGKTCTMSHVYHALRADEATITLQFGDIRKWMQKHLEVLESTWKPGRFDHVGNSQIFLRQFLDANKLKIEGLKTHKDYKWTAREVTAAGAPLEEVVATGIERPKYAADCLSVLLKELKLHCREDRCKIAIFIDGLNLLFGEYTMVNKDREVYTLDHYRRDQIETMCKPEDLTFVINLRKMLGNDYGNATVVASVDQTLHFWSDVLPESVTWRHRQKVMLPQLRPDAPFALLGQTGWELLDPFVPVEIPAFSESELDVLIDFMSDKKYIRSDSTSDSARGKFDS